MASKPLSLEDKPVLRDLAARVAEVAALPVQQETIRLTKALNGLKPERPMAMIDQIPWHEMNVDGELTLQTEDSFCRQLETQLRRTLYAWEHLRVDRVVEPVVEVPMAIEGLDFGLEVVEETAAIDPENDILGHLYIDQLNDEEDVEKIRTWNRNSLFCAGWSGGGGVRAQVAHRGFPGGDQGPAEGGAVSSVAGLVG